MAQFKQRTKATKADFVGSLFDGTPNFRIVQLGSRDARKSSDNLGVLRNLLLSNEGMYPSIGQWYEQKVVPGLKTAERIAYVAFEGEDPIASAVLKLGDHAKFCHLKIHQDFRDLDLGQMFFTQMTLEARHIAKDIHFTLPEGLWESKKGFFKSFGFSAAQKAGTQYRHGEAELSCIARTSVVWKNALEKLPHLMERFAPGGYSMSSRLLLSMRPKYAERVFAGTKQVEIRRKFSTKWRGSRAVVYGSQPVGALMGEVIMSEITPGSPDYIWERFGNRVGCTFEEFSSYTGGTHQVYAIELSDVTPYMAPVGLAQISYLISEDLHPPQSFRDVKAISSDAWGKAISVAGLLHGRFNVSRAR